MIWHILRKDVRLLWAIALAVAAIHFAAAGAQFWLGPLQQPGQLVTIAYLLSLVSLVGVVVLTLSVMHQDAVPGVRQDWLVRPINRAEMIGAKLLFVALIVQGPLLLADLGEGLASGFSFPASLGAAAARNVTVLCFFSLPALMIGAVTRNAVESFLVAIAGLVIYVTVILIGMVLLLGIKNVHRRHGADVDNGRDLVHPRSGGDGSGDESAVLPSPDDNGALSNWGRRRGGHPLVVPSLAGGFRIGDESLETALTRRGGRAGIQPAAGAVQAPSGSRPGDWRRALLPVARCRRPG